MSIGTGVEMARAETWQVAEFTVAKKCDISDNDAFGEARLVLKDASGNLPPTNVVASTLIAGPEGKVFTELEYSPEFKKLGRLISSTSQWDFDPEFTFTASWRGFFDDRDVITGDYHLEAVLDNGQVLTATATVSSTADPCSSSKSSFALEIENDFEAAEDAGAQSQGSDDPTPKTPKLSDDRKKGKGIIATWQPVGTLNDFFRHGDSRKTTSGCAFDFYEKGKRIGLVYISAPTLVRACYLPQCILEEIIDLGGDQIKVSSEIKDVDTGQKTRSASRSIKLNKCK